MVRDAANIATPASGLSTTTMCTSPFAALCLEDALYRWMCAQSNRGNMLNAALVLMKGAQLLDEANKHRHLDDLPNLQFSKGGSATN